MSLNPHSIMANSPNPLERKVILGHLLAGGLGLALLLSGFAIRVEDTGACLAILAHEEGEVDVTTSAFFVTTSNILVKHVLEFVVFETNGPRNQFVVVVVLGFVSPADENGVILSIAHNSVLIRIEKIEITVV